MKYWKVIKNVFFWVNNCIYLVRIMVISCFIFGYNHKNGHIITSNSGGVKSVFVD